MFQNFSKDLLNASCILNGFNISWYNSETDLQRGCVPHPSCTCEETAWQIKPMKSAHGDEKACWR